MSLCPVTSESLAAVIEERWNQFVDELAAFCSIPGVSADPAHKVDMERSASFLADGLTRLGFAVEFWGPADHPAVYAEKVSSAERPTVLIYGHHDVQPVDPVEEWDSPPFSPVVHDGALFARGAEDDKGQVWMHVKALETLLAAGDQLPVNVKLLVESEEETGSAHFEQILMEHRPRLSADWCIVSDTAFFGHDVPSICTRLRGLVTLEVTVTGPDIDLHSGGFGGAVRNPTQALASLLASLHSDSGHVQVPGFYDSVRSLTPAESASLQSLPFSEDVFRKEAGNIPALWGEPDFSPLERLWTRPTCEINGITAGYGGPGSKTIIPSRASAKLSCRVVPEQDPHQLGELVAAFLESNAPPEVRVTTRVGAAGRPVVIAWEQPLLVAARAVMREVWGKEPVESGTGGSIPPVEAIGRVLGIPCVLFGVGLPDAQIHAPNERFDLGQYKKGIRAIALLLIALSKEE